MPWKYNHFGNGDADRILDNNAGCLFDSGRHNTVQTIKHGRRRMKIKVLRPPAAVRFLLKLIIGGKRA